MAKYISFLSLFLKQLTLNETRENIDLGYAKITVQTEKLTAENRRMDIYIHIQTKEQSFGICKYQLKSKHAFITKTL